MTGFNSKQRMAADKDALFEKFEVAQPAQEPVGQVGAIGSDGFVGHIYDDRKVKTGDKLYTAPPQRPWVGLTVQERNDCLVQADPCECLADPEAHQLMVEVEAKLRERNT
jgi:hypothetical protein